MKIAVITHRSSSGEAGGAEQFYSKLINSLRNKNLDVEELEVVCDESTFEGILKAYLDCYDLDLSKYDGVISTKAPTYTARHTNHICYLVHTIRVFYDMFDEINKDKENYKRRELINHIDNLALSPDRTKKVFTIGQEVADRLQKWNNIKSEVLYPGITDDNFYCGDYEYVFLPGRLHKWKRVDLLIESMKYVKSPIKLKIAGKGDYLSYLRELANNDERIEFLGYVEDSQIKELYANALVVPFIPVREDYGYILHEAYKSKKPVITCTDSGEPSRFVKDGESGFIVHPNPMQIANCIDKLYYNRKLAKQMGENGFKSIQSITWDNVATRLINELGGKING